MGIFCNSSSLLAISWRTLGGCSGMMLFKLFSGTNRGTQMFNARQVARLLSLVLTIARALPIARLLSRVLSPTKRTTHLKHMAFADAILLERSRHLWYPLGQMRCRDQSYAKRPTNWKNTPL